jgi:hypothetical protein
MRTGGGSFLRLGLIMNSLEQKDGQERQGQYPDQRSHNHSWAVDDQ